MWPPPTGENENLPCRSIESGKSAARNPSNRASAPPIRWNETSDALVVLRGETPEGKTERANVLLITSGIGLTQARAQALKDAGLDHIQLSFQDSTKELNDFLSSTRTFDHKNKVAATIKGLERGSGGVLCIWGIGYNQHLHGQNNTVSLINLMALTGNIGRPGCGPHSQTGQPNAMGERLTGGLTGRLPFNVGMNDEKHRNWCADQWGIPRERLEKVASMQNTGMAVGMMERALKGEVQAMFLIYATHIDLPDAYNLSRPALTKTFTVVQEIYKDAPNNLYADVILPAATWGEWINGIYVQSERRLFVTEGTGNPVKGCRPDMDMVIDKGKMIGKLLGLDMTKVFPYERKENGYYDPEEVFRDFLKASKGTDADLSGILEVEKETGKSPYQQIKVEIINCKYDRFFIKDYQCFKHIGYLLPRLIPLINVKFVCFS